MGNQGAPTVGAGAGGFCVVLPSGDDPSPSWRSGSCPRRRPGRPSCRSTRVACGGPTSMRGAPTPATNGSARRSSWATSWSALIVVLGPAGAEGTSAKPTPFATGQRGLPVSIASSERTAGLRRSAGRRLQPWSRGPAACAARAAPGPWSRCSGRSTQRPGCPARADRACAAEDCDGGYDRLPCARGSAWTPARPFQTWGWWTSGPTPLRARRRDTRRGAGAAPRLPYRRGEAVP